MVLPSSACNEDDQRKYIELLLPSKAVNCMSDSLANCMVCDSHDTTRSIENIVFIHAMTENAFQWHIIPRLPF